MRTRLTPFVMLRRCRRLSGGFSLIEAMISMVVLSVVMTALVSQMSVLDTNRRITAGGEQGNELVRTLMEKIQACDMEVLGDSAHWSQPLFLTSTEGQKQDGLSADQLQSLGLTERVLALEDVNVYFEYYRGFDAGFDGEHVLSNNALQPGILQYADESTDAYVARINDSVLDQPTGYRLYDRSDILSVGEDPIVIRIVITWADSGRMTVYTSRRRGAS